MTHPAEWHLPVETLDETFTLHLQGGVRIPVLRGETLTVYAGECVVLTGPSGAGKSTLLRCLAGNYGAGGGCILVHAQDGTVTDLATAGRRRVAPLCRHVIGHVSQFLRVIPHVPASTSWLSR